MLNKLISPNDSLQQSTREPSQRSVDIPSLDTASFNSSRRQLIAGATMGGGPYTVYMLDQLSRMHTDIEATTRKLELEQRRLAKLDKDLEVGESEYDAKRQRYKLFQPQQDDVVQHKEAQVRQLEKRLIKAIEDLNKGLSENKQLREQIDLLRRERELLNTVFRQLERGISGNRRAMDRQKAAANEDKMVSEDAKQKSRALGKLLDRERAQFHKDTEKLAKEVSKLSEVEKERERPRAPERTLDGAAATQGKSRRTYMVADEEEAFSEQSMHRRILKLAFLNTIQRRHIRQHQKNIEVFEQAFATIRSSTGFSDIEEIVKIFVILEQRNFSLLTYVNQLNQDIEYVTKRNRELELQMENHKSEESESLARKDSALKDVSMQIATTKSSTREKTKMIKEAEAALEDCRPLIWNIVKFLKKEIPNLVRAAFEGDAPPMKTAAPDEHEENLNHFLMYIEEAIGQFKVSLAPDTKPAGQPAKAPAKAAEPKSNDLPPMKDDESDNEDPEMGFGDRPWTKNELRERVQANIQKRRKKPGQGSRPGHEERGRLDASDDLPLAPMLSSTTSATLDRSTAPSAPELSTVPSMEASFARRDAGPPPPKNYASSSVTSKESGGDSGSGTFGSGNKLTPASAATTAPIAGAGGREAAPPQDEGGPSDETWWKGQGTEKRR